MPQQAANRTRSKAMLVAIIVLLIATSVMGALYYVEYVQANQNIASLNKTITSLNTEVSSLEKSQAALAQLETANGTYPGASYFPSSSDSINATAIYKYANESVVTVEGIQTTTSYGQTVSEEVLGTGFVVVYANKDYIITNYHVVEGDSDLSVTFSDGNAYSAKVVGSDPYSDLAVLSANASSSEFHPLAVVPSSSLVVGESVVAIGSPFGLSGSITEGIISQLGRTIQDETAGNYSIANVIQISTPINPGNSGSPLLASNGEVVGITTAIVSGSQGIGFAIPSDTIIRELPDLIATGHYNLHPYLGIGEASMNYDLAQAMGTNVTYGVLVETVVLGGPAANAGLRGGSTTQVVDGSEYYLGGDIIISVNGTRVVSTDSLSSWLDEHALPGEVVQLGIVRSGSYMTVNLTLGTRPPLA